MSQLNFAEIKQQVPILKGAEFLGLTLREDGNSLRTNCPACEGDDRSLSILEEANVFKCFASNKYGSVLDLVCHVKGISLREAGIWLKEQGTEEWLADYDGEKVESKSDESVETSNSFDPAKYLSELEYENEMVQALGFSPEDAKALGVGYCNKGVHRGRVAVRLSSSNGKGVFMSITEAKLPKRWSL